MFKNLDKKTLNVILYVFVFVLISVVFWVVSQVSVIRNFVNAVENKTFDYRQALLVKNKHQQPSENIMILAIDEASYEYILTKYGEWPLPRDVYANLIHYLEKYNPNSIAFDLMFVNSMKSSKNADSMLVEAMNKYDNVYTSMNFDNQDFDLRYPIDLPDRLRVTVKKQGGEYKVSNELSFLNCRHILPQLLEGSVNIGMINVARNEDGILRKTPPFLQYKNKFYPHLSFKVGERYIYGHNNNIYTIDSNSNLILGENKYPIDEDGGMILNWYGPTGTHRHVPIYKVIKAMEEGTELKDLDFNNKIIYIGATAVSLYDTKSVPVDKLYPGVETHTTFINNMIDDSFIKKIDNSVTIAITLLLALVIWIAVILIPSTVGSIFVGVTVFGLYSVIAYYAMKLGYLWLNMTVPLLAIVLAFMVGYILKYIIKSQDFEYQYKLATTDGLTELYNHRYFQEQMKMQIETARRYGQKFSLIIIDIDYFKKFNDTYGHQAGDAVLKQVAQTLKRNSRSTDIVCRYGGEEMSIILPNTSEKEVLQNAERMCKAVAEKTFKFSATQEGNVTISLGVATYPECGDTPQSLIEYADKGLYYAKEHGRNQVGITE